MTEQANPPGWGSDKLSNFIDLAQNNEKATFANKKGAYTRLRVINSIYHDLAENLINTKEILPGLLYLRAHSAYIASCRLSMSGEIAESFVMARSCLEYSLYAYHIYKKPDAAVSWIDRHKSEAAYKKCRSEFSYKNVLGTLVEKYAQLVKDVDMLYEACIDFGGHPNERAVMSALKVEQTSTGFDLKQLYLIGDSLVLDHSLLNSARVGLCSLCILEKIWSERFAILGITEKLDTLRKLN